MASVSAAPLPLREQMHHEMVQDLRRDGIPAGQVEQVLRLGELAMAHARQETDVSWGAYDAALRVLREGPLAKVAGAFPAARDHWRWRWWHQVIDVDPLPAWSESHGPRLAVFGASDEQDNVPVGKSVERLARVFRQGPASPDVIRVFPERGHSLVDPARGWVDRSILCFISEWVVRAVGGTRPVACTMEKVAAAATNTGVRCISRTA